MERLYGIKEARPEKLPNYSVVKTQSDLAERIEYARRIERIEAEKARERQAATQFGGSVVQENFPEPINEGQTRDIAAQKAGISSGSQYEREKYIVDKDIYRESTLTHFRTQLIIYLTRQPEDR